MSYTIPFNKPSFVGDELDNIAKAIAAGHISGDGPFSQRCGALLEETLGVPKSLLTPSCTHALEMAAFLLNVGPGDEVIIPSFTFVSTANAFAVRGARIEFADIRGDTLNLDEKQLEAKITPNTRAVVPVHYGGVGCEMDTILAIARKHELAVVEDNAHGLFGLYRGRWLGSLGCLAAQSFHETKNINCGEGGALLINDPGYVGRAEIIRDKGTNRNLFFRGVVDSYTWVDLGSSYLLSDVLAAFLLAQLEARNAIHAQRQMIWERYHGELADWAQRRGASLPVVPDYCEQSYHLFYMLLPSRAERQAFIAHLREREILAVFHYMPLHLSPMGRAMGAEPGQCPVTEDISERIVRLPFYNAMTEQEQAQVIAAVLDF